MIKSILKIFLLVCFIGLLACKSDNIQSGLKGTINFAIVDCNLDQSFWQYEKYNGIVYAISKDSVSNYSHDFNLYSDSIQAINGEFTIGLNPGHYYIFIKEYQAFNFDTEITVHLNQVTKKEFRFHNCL